MKQWFKQHSSLIAKIGLVLVIVFVVPLPKVVEVDFYEFHVWECEQVHAQNLTFSIMSGFGIEPCEEHLNSSWYVHPLENPREHIAHGSNLGTCETVFVFGVYGWLTTPFYVSSYDVELPSQVVYTYPNGTVEEVTIR